MKDFHKEDEKLSKTEEENSEKDSEKKTQEIKKDDEIAEKNAAYKKGGGINYDKVANLIINDFRKGLIGNISLEN